MSVSDLVGEIEGVRRRTRRASYGAAVPLALLGLLVAAAAPIYGVASDSNTHFPDEGPVGWTYVTFGGRPSLLDRLLWVHSTGTRHAAIGIFWLVAAPLVFAAIAAYYRRRAGRTGLSVDGWRVAAAGVGTFAALVGVMAFGAFNDYGWGLDEGLRAGDLVSPFLVVGLGVFVLAWVERSVLVALGGVAYVAALVFGQWATFGSLSNPEWRGVFAWSPMIVYLGLVLLLTAGVCALVQRTRRA